MTSTQPGSVWTEPARPVGEPVTWRREGLVALATSVSLVLCGAPLGLVWGWLSPDLDIPAVIAGSESAFSVQFDQDLILLALGLLAGVIAGLATLRWARGHEAGAVVGLAVGGILAGLIAATVGHRYRMPALLHYIKPGLDAPTRAQTVALIGFRLRIGAFALAFPVAALLTVAAKVLFATPDGAADARGAQGQPLPSLGAPPERGSPAADPWWSAPR